MTNRSYKRKENNLTFFILVNRRFSTSNKQFKQRARFRKAMENWKLVTPDDREKWNKIAFSLSICASGMNLHMSLGLNPDHENFLAVTEKLNLHPPEPEPIP